MNEVLFEIRERIAILTINRPDQRNALNRDVLHGLRESLRDAAADPAARVIAITGEGDKAFCAGADLKAPASSADAGHFGRNDFRSLLVEIADCPKPTVALARGHVMAGGLGIFLACDLTLACDDVHFSTPEISVGMFPMMVLALLFRNVGLKRGTEMLFTGERVTAAEAVSIGLVNRTFPRSDFAAQSSAYLERLASRSPTILRLGKEAMRDVEGKGLRESLENLEKELERLMATEDSREGIRAFVEKRPPRWKE